jgi:CRP-like cAMP-binding protein
MSSKRYLNREPAGETSQSGLNPLVRHLEHMVSLTDEERAAIERLPMQITEIQADQDIVREGDRPSKCFAILEGFAMTFKVTGAGKRQIVAFHIPGDMPDLQSLHLEVLDISVSALTRCKVGFVQHEALRDLCARFPRLADAFWRETLVASSVFREWVMNVGQRQAHARVAHVLCEWVRRMEAMGLAADHTCELPMTQNELADATGMTTVHVNRTLQRLRAEGLISLAGSKLAVLDWEGLKEAGDFDPTYLHLSTGRQRAA